MTAFWPVSRTDEIILVESCGQQQQQQQKNQQPWSRRWYSWSRQQSQLRFRQLSGNYIKVEVCHFCYLEGGADDWSRVGVGVCTHSTRNIAQTTRQPVWLRCILSPVAIQAYKMKRKTSNKLKYQVTHRQAVKSVQPSCKLSEVHQAHWILN